LSIGIGERRCVALCLGHGIKTAPILFGFHFAITTPMRATER
jgi:hypothetical protein